MFQTTNQYYIVYQTILSYTYVYIYYNSEYDEHDYYSIVVYVLQSIVMMMMMTIVIYNDDNDHNS